MHKSQETIIMSSGVACECKPPDRANWVIVQYKCNHSAFNGWRYTPSAYSEIRCMKCRGLWRTKAKYVKTLKHAVGHV